MNVQKAENDEYVLEIFQDEVVESPREWDNLGKMICFHNRYNLGDEHSISSADFENWEQLENYLIKEMGAIIVLPLRLYDHSGISISTSSSYPYDDTWDSGQIGFIIATREQVLNEWKVKRISKKLLNTVRKNLIYEVKAYDDYLTGNIYGFTLSKKNQCKTCKNIDIDFVDSCGGFYGSDDITKQMKGHIEEKYHYLFDELEDI